MVSSQPSFTDGDLEVKSGAPSVSGFLRDRFAPTLGPQSTVLRHCKCHKPAPRPRLSL